MCVPVTSNKNVTFHRKNGETRKLVVGFLRESHIPKIMEIVEDFVEKIKTTTSPGEGKSGWVGVWWWWCGHSVAQVSLSIPLHACTELGWQNTWES